MNKLDKIKDYCNKIINFNENSYSQSIQITARAILAKEILSLISEE